MESRIANDKSSQTISLIRRLRPNRNHKTVASSILERIAHMSGGTEAAADQGFTRMKLVVKKDELKQVLEAIRDGRSSIQRSASGLPASASLEHRLNLMRRRQIFRAASQGRSRNRGGSWRPALQSIPEE